MCKPKKKIRLESQIPPSMHKLEALQKILQERSNTAHRIATRRAYRDPRECYDCWWNTFNSFLESDANIKHCLNEAIREVLQNKEHYKQSSKMDSIFNDNENIPAPIDLRNTDEVAVDFVIWFRYIHENTYKKQRPFHISEIIKPNTEPELYWFNKIFGSIGATPIDINSKIGNIKVRCYITDRYYMEHYKANYIGDIDSYEAGNLFYIRARLDGNTKISLIFHNRDLYEKIRKKILGY